MQKHEKYSYKIISHIGGLVNKNVGELLFGEGIIFAYLCKM